MLRTATAFRSRLPLCVAKGTASQWYPRLEDLPSERKERNIVDGLPKGISFTASWNEVSTSQRRLMSTNSGDAVSNSNSDSNNTTQFDETMDKLFLDSQKEATTPGDAWFLDESTQSLAFEPSWWNLADQAVRVVSAVEDVTGIPYAGAIVATTVAIRLAILPLAIKGQRSASRMAHLQPELTAIKSRYESLGTPTQAEQKAFAEQMRGLFKRYEVNPLASLGAPLVQMPIFLGMFFGMKKIPDILPEELATGGILWFTNLTIPDPTYMLPVICGLSFFGTIETGKEQMIDANPAYGPLIVNAFRAMAVVMVPVIITFPAAMLCYWVPNNVITLIQSVTLRNATVRKHLGIWDRPKPVPGQNNDANFQDTMTNLMKKAKGEPTTEREIIQQHNQEIDTKRKVQAMSKATRARRRVNKKKQ